MPQPNERIQHLIGIAVAKNTIAAAMIAGLCIGMRTLTHIYSSTTGGTVFGYLFFVVGLMAFLALLIGVPAWLYLRKHLLHVDNGASNTP